MEVNTDAASNKTEAAAIAKTRKSRGRQRIEIKKLEDKSKRQVTFSKRRQGLFKKAKEITTLCGAEVAVFALSGSGKVYKNDNAEAVLDRFLAQSTEADDEGRFWWDQPVENLSLVELVNYVMALKDLRYEAETRLEELRIMNSNCLWPWVSDQHVSKAEFLHKFIHS